MAFGEWLATTRNGPAGFKDKLPIWQSTIGSRRAPGDGFSLLGLLLSWSRFALRVVLSPKVEHCQQAERNKAGWLAVMRDVTGEKQAPSGHPLPFISLAANPFDFRGNWQRLEKAPMVSPILQWILCCVSSLIYQPACDHDSWNRPS
ncbi:uncharacterized protein PpBr36_05734 [Pyricularia pennisetigena]|uniref:uncharacterized protein n=1 Tax=Pyricularia pennisetigena TaxID=1578925 RepID=UPI001152350C|nr:uncharacterized protein PpBr36_05734 [Pyricularia pennisetigena]TLS22613.1 hypothetical protein PpBr36_05734 [Pyricularia pennisetigena]